MRRRTPPAPPARAWSHAAGGAARAENLHANLGARVLARARRACGATRALWAGLRSGARLFLDVPRLPASKGRQNVDAPPCWSAFAQVRRCWCHVPAADVLSPPPKPIDPFLLHRSPLHLVVLQVEVPTDLVIRFVTNESISTGDVVTVALPGFGAGRPDFRPTLESFSAFRKASWVCSLTCISQFPESLRTVQS